MGEKIKNEKAEKEKELKKIKSETKSKDDTFEQLIKEKAEAVRKAEYLKLELEEVKEEAKSNEVSAQDKRRLSSLNSEIDDLRRSNKQLEASNEGKNKIFSALKAEIEQLKNKNKSLQIEASDKEKDRKNSDDKTKEIQVLKKDIDKMFAEKSALKKQTRDQDTLTKQIKDQEKKILDQEMKLKEQEKVLKENDSDKRSSLEKASLLKQIKEMEVEKALNETYKKEMLELSGEIRKKGILLEAEVSKTKSLTEQLETEKKEKAEIQEKLSKQSESKLDASNQADEEEVE